MLPSINQKNRPVVRKNGKAGIVTDRDFKKEMAQACSDVKTWVAKVGWEVSRFDCYIITATLPFFLWPEEKPWGRRRDEDNYWKALLDELVDGGAVKEDSLVVGHWTNLRFEYNPRKLLADIRIYRFAQEGMELPPIRQFFDDWVLNAVHSRTDHSS